MQNTMVGGGDGGGKNIKLGVKKKMEEKNIKTREKALKMHIFGL